MGDGIEPGQRWELTCPFYVEQTEEFERWRPGTYETQYGVADDGTGKEVREVVAVFELPKPYQTRVFYKRSWVAPDGHTFGRNRLDCVALLGFRRWTHQGPQWNRQSDGATLAIGDAQ